MWCPLWKASKAAKVDDEPSVDDTNEDRVHSFEGVGRPGAADAGTRASAEARANAQARARPAAGAGAIAVNGLGAPSPEAADAVAVSAAVEP